MFTNQQTMDSEPNCESILTPSVNKYEDKYIAFHPQYVINMESAWEAKAKLNNLQFY